MTGDRVFSTTERRPMRRGWAVWNHRCSVVECGALYLKAERILTHIPGEQNECWAWLCGAMGGTSTLCRGYVSTEPAAQLAAEQAARRILEGMLATLKETTDGE